MLPEIITFNKSMPYRLEEYQQLLDGIETPCSEITEIWGSIFEDLVVIGVDWHALWMLSEGNCKKYDLLYPTAVIVNVDDFKWEELTASISVLAVQEDIVIPSAIEVPVIELHPIKVQDYDETDLRDIEDWLDKCRYFFRNLWYPWDAKLDVRMLDWCESHLRNRLKMQYDMKNGVFDKNISNYIKLLLAEAQNINFISSYQCSQEDDRLTAVKRYIRRKIIKTELDLFEEPDLRHGMILLKRKDRHLRTLADEIEDNGVKFVWAEGNCESLINYLKMSQTMVDKNVAIKVCRSLQEALDMSSTNDVIILPPGTHAMTLLTGIENGGRIIGLDRSDSIIMPDSLSIPRAILFECFGYIQLENLTISKPSGIVIQVFDGIVKLSNCRILSKDKNSTSRGIVVVSGSKLFMDDCQLMGFGTAIALQGDTIASLKNTTVLDCCEGIKVTENATLALHRVDISSCSTFGIRVESSEISSEIPLVGDLNLLEQNQLRCKISASSVTFRGNIKGDVLVKKSEKIVNFEEPSGTDVSSDVLFISDREDEDSP